jgi:hypothetical protein
MVGNCRASLFTADHDLVIEQRRVASTGELVKPHVIDWRCVRCWKLVGTTELGAKWALLARLRRQALALRKVING